MPVGCSSGIPNRASVIRMNQISILHRDGSVTVCCGTVYDGKCFCNAPGKQAQAVKVEFQAPSGKIVGIGFGHAVGDASSSTVIAGAMDLARIEAGQNTSPVRSRG